MENHHTNDIENLFEKTSDYFETRVDLFKLKAVDKTADIISSLLSRLVIILFISSCFLMLNIGLALLIGQYFGQYCYGFFVIAAFYLVVLLIVFLLRESILKAPVTNMIIKSIFK